MRVTTRVLKTIDKVGGLDEYLLGEKSARIKELGMNGWLLRWRIMQTPGVKKRFRRERRALGLVDEKEQSVGRDGKEVSEDQLREQIDGFDRELDEDEARVEAEESRRTGGSDSNGDYSQRQMA